MKYIFLEDKDTGLSESESTENAAVEETADTPEAETLSSPAEKNKKTRNPGMVKLQKILIASFAAAAVVLGILYFAWLKPMADKLAEEEPTEIPELLEGEAYDTTGYGILMFPHVEMKNIQTIEIHNSYETYTCERSEYDDGGFYIVEHPQAPVGTEIFTSLAVDVGYTAVVRRISENCEDFGKYGLGEDDDPSYYILTDTSGNTHTVYIGDLIPTGGGYYARYEGRNVLYVIDSGIGSTALSPSTALMTPLLGYPLSQNSYSKVAEFLLYKNGQPFIYIEYNEETNYDDFALSAYNMLYPANYVVNDDNFASVLLYSLVQLSGYQVLEAGTPDAMLINDEAKMAEYGFYDLQNMPFEMYYRYEDQTTTVVFTPSGVDGYYFAYSYLYDMIVLVEEATVEYLQWDLIKYVNSALFAEHINDVTDIAVTGKLRYEGKVYDVDEQFSIRTVEISSGSSALEGYAHSTDSTFVGNRPANNPVQGFYGSALAMKMQGYIKAEGVDISTLDEYATMTVTNISGEKTVYRFYRYSERCYYTIDGVGEFYLSLRDVNKLLIDAVRAAYGLFVDTNEQYPELPERYIENQAK